MSEFGNLKDKAEQYAQQHPEQVKKGEEAVENQLGIGQQDRHVLFAATQDLVSG